jgi:hypothetical protein
VCVCVCVMLCVYVYVCVCCVVCGCLCALTSCNFLSLLPFSPLPFFHLSYSLKNFNLFYHLI